MIELSFRQNTLTQASAARIHGQCVTLVLAEETTKVGATPGMFITGGFTVKANRQGLYLQREFKLMLFNTISRHEILMCFEGCCDSSKPAGTGNIRGPITEGNKT